MTDGSTPHVVDAAATGLGPRLRQLRHTRGISVRELARRAGYSASLISQVERGVTTPSASVVYALANELGISLDFLFGAGDLPKTPHASSGDALAPPQSAFRPWGRASDANGTGIVQRAGDRSVIELSTGVRWERLTPTHDDWVDFLEVVYAPGGQSSDGGQAVRHDGREYLYVLHGELEAVIGFDTLRLYEGDSLAFDPATPHQYRNHTTQVARALSVVVHNPTR
ncbi:helix-turn-helix domain-containing protein [uncultured Mycobacterium sp.]|uniref:helix-turn-helix domain-containing protein n=1 Tax=uncultured Mycobacterium sp. TaxID=171292 RepID=UPI0035CA0827